jgi:radical SAM superfamily enzyme YgiQ (UPF0313 family)
MSPYLINAKKHSTAISPDRRTVFAFDLEGRPISWYQQDRVFKRSLASEVFARKRVAGRRRYWQLSDEDAADQFARMRRALASAPVDASDTDLVARLDRIRSWTPELLLGERARFDAAYRPITILPPDQYLSIVLQASIGCSWNRCTFCNFYQDRPFNVRETDDFREHCESVRGLLGQGASLRRRIFLADGNALTLSNRRLLPLAELAREFFSGRGLYGFVDVFAGEKKTVDEWDELRRAGLRRVYVGVETGDDRLLGWLNKPGSSEDAGDFVKRLKTAGLRVSLIFMAGIGGSKFASEHVRQSLALAERLALDDRDVVYLSPFRTPDGSAYAERAEREGVVTLDEAATEAQYAELKDGIRRILPRTRVTRYDIREFIY